MTDLKPTHDAIAEMAKAVRIAQIQLAGLVLGVCPGPHRPTQHRDGQPPWCKTCGYTSTGVRVKTPAEGTR